MLMDTEFTIMPFYLFVSEGFGFLYYVNGHKVHFYSFESEGFGIGIKIIPFKLTKN